MAGHQSAPADAGFRVAFFCENAFDQLDPRPDTAGILPTASRSTDPLAQNSARGSKPTFILLQRTSEQLGLPRGTHAKRDERCQQISRNGQTRSFGDVVDAADDFYSTSRSGKTREQFRE